ncbi:hypothetical protein B9T07_24780 [Limnospira fusiformis CCALA 023]
MVSQVPVFVKRKTEIFRIFLGLAKLVIGSGFMEFRERVRSPFLTIQHLTLFWQKSTIFISKQYST